MFSFTPRNCGSNSRVTGGLRLFLVLFLGLFAVCAALAQSYNWKNVTIKGGGFVTGIIPHPGAPGLIYCRTDIGGAYRWNGTNASWIPLLDFADSANLFGVESLAIDPSDTNRLYIATSRGWPEVLLSGVNAGGEGTNSLEVSARPTSFAPTELGLTAVGNQLQLNWPADHTGWQLQGQTNSLGTGLGTNWSNIAGSAETNQIILPADVTNDTVFFRLKRP